MGVVSSAASLFVRRYVAVGGTSTVTGSNAGTPSVAVAVPSSVSSA